MFPLRSLGEDLPGLFQLLVAPGIPWLMAASLQSLPLLSHGLLPVRPFSVSYVDALIGSRAHPNLL